MDLKAHENISFSIPSAERVAVSAWLSEVKTFFCTTGNSVSEPSVIFTPSLQPSTSNDKDKNVENTAPKPSHLEDVLEGITVHSIVHLVSILGNFDEGIRLTSARLLFKIACVFDKKLAESSNSLENIAQEFEINDQGKEEVMIRFLRYSS